MIAKPGFQGLKALFVNFTDSCLVLCTDQLNRRHFNCMSSSISTLRYHSFLWLCIQSGAEQGFSSC